VNHLRAVPLAALLAGLFNAGCGVRDMAGASAAASKAVDSLFQCPDLGTWTSSYETMMAPAFRQVTSKEDYEKLGKAIQDRMGKLVSKDTKRSFVRNMNGVTSIDVGYEAQFEQGKATIDATLTKVGEGWQFVSFRVNSPRFLDPVGTVPCKSCGKPHPKDASFCPACGKKIEGHSSVPSGK